MNKTGWEWEKYEKYNEFYDKINNTDDKYGFKSGGGVDIDVLMIEMDGDTEFDKTWQLTFLYLKRGMEAQRKVAEQVGISRQERDRVRRGEIRSVYDSNAYIMAENDIKVYTIEVKRHYNQSYVYRQKIEEMKPSR